MQAPDAPSWPDVRTRLLPVSQSQQGYAHQASMPPGIRITRVSWHCRCSTTPQALPTLTFKCPWSLDPPTSLPLLLPQPISIYFVLTKSVNGRAALVSSCLVAKFPFLHDHLWCQLSNHPADAIFPHTHVTSLIEVVRVASSLGSRLSASRMYESRRCFLSQAI